MASAPASVTLDFLVRAEPYLKLSSDSVSFTCGSSASIEYDSNAELSFETEFESISVTFENGVATFYCEPIEEDIETTVIIKATLNGISVEETVNVFVEKGIIVSVDSYTEFDNPYSITEQRSEIEFNVDKSSLIYPLLTSYLDIEEVDTRVNVDFEYADGKAEAVRVDSEAFNEIDGIFWKSELEVTD